MIKYVLIILTLGLNAGYSMACDVCGCGVNTSFFGIMPQGNGHFAGLRYGQASFNASMVYNSPLLEDEHSDDLFQRVDLLANASLTDRIHVALSIPYIMNEMKGTHQNANFHGIGDIAVLGFYKPDLMKGRVAKFQQTLFVGGGLELPTGSSDRESGDELINKNFQLGSGSWDLLLSANYSLAGFIYGFNLESGYKINTVSSSGYQFGNQWSANLNFFKYLQTPEWSFIPFVGTYFETSAAHYEGMVKQANTGGWAMMANAGVKVIRKVMSCEMIYQLPIAQNFDTDQFARISANRRLTLMVGINF